MKVFLKAGDTLTVVTEPQILPVLASEGTSKEQLIDAVAKLTMALREIAFNKARTALCSWTVQSYTTPTTGYTVSLMINGQVECTCKNFKYTKAYDDGSRRYCKHISDTYWQHAVAVDRARGIAAEHRELVTIARRALGMDYDKEPDATPAKGYVNGRA